MTEHIVYREDLREAIKLWIKVTETDWFKERPANVQKLYNQYPPWKFYTNKEQTVAYRVYSIGECEDGTLVLETASAGLAFTNLTVGGCRPGDLIPVKKYTGNVLNTIMYSPDRNTFLSPSGWTHFLR